MIIREKLEDMNLYRSYSDQGFPIKQIETGIIYAEAIDKDASTYTYEEVIPTEEEWSDHLKAEQEMNFEDYKMNYEVLEEMEEF